LFDVLILQNKMSDLESDDENLGEEFDRDVDNNFEI
jgi:hypothetical protein